MAKTVLTDLHIDALREVANIGMGHAVTSLSAMVDESFVMSVPAFGVVALTEFAEILGDLEAQAAAVYMPVLGDAPGHVAFLFPYKHACELADVLLGQPRGTIGCLDEMACSALMEVGNVLISSFVSAISDLTHLFLPVSPPGIAIDMTGAILQSLSTVSPDLGDHALTIMTRLADSTFPIEGIFIYIPEPTALPTLFRALGIDL